MPIIALLIVAAFCIHGEPKYCDDWRHAGDNRCRPTLRDQEVAREHQRGQQHTGGDHD